MSVVSYNPRGRGAAKTIVAVANTAYRHRKVIKKGARKLAEYAKGAYDYFAGGAQAPPTIVEVNTKGSGHRSNRSGARGAKSRLRATYGSHTSGGGAVYMPLQEECLGTITSPGAAFTSTNFLLQPANVTSFPLLSKLMVNYDKVKTEQWYYRFESSSGTAVGSTNTALGTVLMNASYDVLDGAFTNQIDMEDYGRSGAKKCVKEAVPSKNQTFSIDTKRHKGVNGDGWMYLLPGVGTTQVTPTGGSAHDYTAGIFQIATAGQQAASTVGRLFVGWSGWVKDRKNDSTGAALVGAHVVENASSTGATGAALGTSGGLVKSGSTLAVVTTNTTFTLPVAGQFLIAATFVGSNTSNATFSYGANIAEVALQQHGGVAHLATLNSGNSSTFITTVLVSASGTAAANTVTIGGLTAYNSGQTDIFIQQMFAGITMSATQTELASIERQLAGLRARVNAPPRITIDSDFDDDEKLPGDELTRSTLMRAVDAYRPAKSNSHK